MKLATAIFLSLALPLPLFAADKEEAPAASTSKVNISQFTFGKTLSGGEVTAESLKGKPVLIEVWGVNCPPCLGMMPKINDIAKRYDGKGLMVIGAESQGSSEEDVAKIVKQYKLKFPVTAGSTHPLSFSGIPHSAVFAADGTMLFEGHPGDKEFDRAIREAVKSAGGDAKEGSSTSATASSSSSITAKSGGPLVAERTWTNADGKPLAAALVKVENGVGTFRRKNGTTFTYDIAKLSSSDQELIAAAQKS